MTDPRTILEIRDLHVPTWKALAAAASTDDARKALTRVIIEPTERGRKLDQTDRLTVWACDSYRMHRLDVDVSMRRNHEGRDILGGGMLAIDLEAARDVGAISTYVPYGGDSEHEYLAVPASIFAAVTGKGDRHLVNIDVTGDKPAEGENDLRRFIATYGSRRKTAEAPVAAKPPDFRQLWPSGDDHQARIGLDPETVAAIERPTRFTAKASTARDPIAVLRLSTVRDNDGKPVQIDAETISGPLPRSRNRGGGPRITLSIPDLTDDVDGPVPDGMAYNAAYLADAVAYLATTAWAPVVNLRLRDESKPALLDVGSSDVQALLMPVRV